jgi:hypothetical protein
MSYIVNKTDGSILTTLLDGTTNTETGLTLIGRNFTSYGEIQNENFVRLLENFAGSIPPGQSVGFAPLAGQLWWDTANQRLRVYNGTSFIPVSEQTVSATAPSPVKLGDQWWDTTDAQFKVYNGNAWVAISPPFTTAQGKSGSLVETVSDTSLAPHTVVNTYTNNQLIAVSSYDPAFQTGAYSQFSFIRPGITLASNVMLHGNVTNSLQLGGVPANAFPRTTARTDFLSDLGVGANLVIGNANVSYSSNTLVINNSFLAGNVDIYVNTTMGNTRAFRINGATGMITVASNPTNNLGVATKIYIDNIESALNTSLVANIANVDANTTALRNDTFLALTTNVAILNNTIAQLRTDTNANVLILDTAFKANVSAIDANLANKTARIDSLESDIVLKSVIASPAFTGTPTAPTPGANNNSTQIATTAYVDAADLIGTTYTTTIVNAFATTAATNLTNGLALKANIIAPAFSGATTSDTPPSTDNSTRIATTAFVRGAITGSLTRWQGSRYTVSTGGPTGGDDGDFWFQIS